MALALSGSLTCVPSSIVPKSASISSHFDGRSIRDSVGFRKFCPIRCSSNPIEKSFRTCKNCKGQFDPSSNHPRACRYHTAHFGGETRRKFESVYSGGTMSTPDGGKVSQYWHCCGSEDPFDPGCTAAPHSSYDD